MPELIPAPTRVTAAGEPPKLIDEYVGAVNTGGPGLSIAHMRSPAGWAEPGQRPEFDEMVLVLTGERARARFWELATHAEWRCSGRQAAGLLAAPAIIVPVADPNVYLARYAAPDKTGSDLAGLPAEE